MEPKTAQGIADHYLKDLKFALHSKRVMMTAFDYKLRYLYGKCVEKGEVIPSDVIRKLLQNICAGDILRETMDCFKRIYVHSKKSKDTQLVEIISKYRYLPLFTEGKIQSFRDPQSVRDAIGMDLPGFKYSKYLLSFVSSYWSDIQHRRSDYNDLVSQICSKVGNPETTDVLLYSFGCHLKEFLDAYTMNMSDGSKYNAYSDIKILLINRIKKKASDKSKTTRKECQQKAIDWYNIKYTNIKGIDDLIKDVLGTYQCKTDETSEEDDDESSSVQHLDGEEEEAISFLVE